MGLFSKLFDTNKKNLKLYQDKVEIINSLEKEYEKLKDEEIKNKTNEFKERIKKGETLEEILPEAFALVREAAKRTIGQRHFDVQIICAIALHEGKIAEMKTGEGKTLAATMPLYLNALSDKGSHLVTVNDYLSRWQGDWMGEIYDFLGLSVGVIQQQNVSYIFDKKTADKNKETEDPEAKILELDVKNLRPCSRKEVYACDIIYGTNNEFGFDYLRDNMARNLEDIVQGELNFAIIDEVDSILIDEARTPLIISAPAEESAELYKKFANLVPNLKENEDYNVDEKAKAVTLTDSGIKKMESLLGVKNIYERGGVMLVHHLEQALKAQVLFKKDKDYVVRDGEIVIIDEFTGRMMFGRRYSEGLHQAIEAKEKVEVKRESITLATISFQNLFRLYKKLAGMTGTAATEKEEFHKIYDLDVIEIPTHKPMIRLDLSDKIYKTEEGKFKAVVREVQKRNQKGQPVLVGTISIEKSERLSDMLRREGIKHEVLNAKHHEKEAKVIARAGRKKMVTIATNMAGRGVDIILGKKVKELGGLHVLGTERHESRRIDNQLRGRAGRQGDPGSSQFYVSTDDDLMRIFGGERIKSIMTTLRVPEDQPIENRLISNSLERAQEKVEAHNFDIRKHLLEYDDVLNRQREIIYKRRKRILRGVASSEKYKNLKEEIIDAVGREIHNVVMFHTSTEDSQKWDKKEIIENMMTIFPENLKNKIEKIKGLSNRESINNYLIEIIPEAYKKREKEVGEETQRMVERALILRSIDNLWVEHLTTLDELRTGIGLRGYGQKDPLTEYKREAFNLFENLIENVYKEVVHLILKIEFNREPQKTSSLAQGSGVIMRGGDEKAAAGTFSGIGNKSDNQVPEKTKSMAKVGRNDPCPCGSGKKFKKCCGR